MNDPAKMSRRDRTIYYQNIFKNRGYDIGPTGVDGIWGPLTNAAYLKYLRDNQDLNSDFDEEDFDENYFNEEDFNREDNKNYNVNITSNRDDNINDNDAIEKMWGKNKNKNFENSFSNTSSNIGFINKILASSKNKTNNSNKDKDTTGVGTSPYINSNHRADANKSANLINGIHYPKIKSMFDIKEDKKRAYEFDISDIISRKNTPNKFDNNNKSNTNDIFDINKFDINNKLDINDTSKIKDLQSFLKKNKFYFDEINGNLDDYTKASYDIYMDSKTEANNTNRFRTMKKKDTTSKSDTTNKFDITKFDIKNKSDIYDTSKVKELQSFLKAMDYYSGEVDGILGPHTKAALNAFQDIKMGTPIKKEYNLKIK